MTVNPRLNPRLRQTCVFCVEWGQSEPNCAHGLLDGDNPGALFFVPARVMTIEIGTRASIASTTENLVGENYRGQYFESLLRGAA